MPSNHYDLIVLGDEFSGLVAATLCARRGLRVLHAQLAPAQVSYQLGPYRLPVEPLPLVGLSGGATRRVLDELHFQHMLKRKLLHQQPPFQLVGPDLRIAVDIDDAVLAREAERELRQAGSLLNAGERASQVAGMLEPLFDLGIAVPPTGFWERREMGRIAGRLIDRADQWQQDLDRDLEDALLSLPAVFASNADPRDLSPVARARAFAEWRQGLAHLPGGWETLRGVFVDKFTSHNGEIRSVEVESFATSWSKVTGLRLTGGEELGAGHVVAAMSVADMESLADRKMRKRLAEAAELVPLGAYRYTLNLVLDEMGVPEGMGSNALVLGDPSAPLHGENALALFVDQPDAEARVAMTVQAICPVQEAGALDDALASLRVGIRERLESIMPFYSEHVRLVHSPHESAPPEAARDGLGDEVHALQVLEPRPLWRLPREPLLGVAGLSYHLGMKQFIVASSQILPGLGLEGEMAAGWCAAKMVCEAAGKKKDYLRDEVLTAGRG